MKDKLAVQLFTLREECKKDFHGVLGRLSEMGWAGVQMAGCHDYDPSELAGEIRKLGMKTAGMHVKLDELRNELARVIAEAKLFDTPDIICPITPLPMRSELGYRQLKRELNGIAEELRTHGMRLSYHNHAFEFDLQVDEQTALDFLLEPASTNHILAEIDVYWIRRAGYDPSAYIRKFSQRMPIIHLKDMTDDEEQAFAEIGTGTTIDFKQILSWGEGNGVEWYVVEQDKCLRDPMDCLQVSWNNVNRMIAQLELEGVESHE
ncbi:sugar phosphate isomerase/epimerase family protein [Paenibacillus chungangensis]|uniref:Sugar phosphate isomerase/epimerase family protein n=1 Tax=Paenibacillus chungangensis TaxID=696535 RepID=A0ABW3HL14_9BACL